MRRLLSSFCLGICLGSSLPLTLASLSWAAPTEGFVDLHAHLFFFEGVGVSWNGNFDSPVRASRWTDRFTSKVNSQELERSGAEVVVVALYAHPLLPGSRRDQIRRQLQAARRFVATTQNWALVRSPEELERALSRKQHALVLSLEGASGILETEADSAEFLDREGIRIVTPVHFTDDWIGGTAFLPGVRGIASPWAWLQALATRLVRGGTGPLTNPNGLTPAGQRAIEGWLARGIWIDLSHASDQLQAALIPVLASRGQPLLYTHTVLRRHYGAERGISDAQLDQFKKHPGALGTLPSDEMLAGTPCEGDWNGLSAFESQYREIGKAIGFENLTIGSDINAPLPMLSTRPAGPKGDEAGLYKYSQFNDLWSRTGLAEKRMTPRQFLAVWKRVTKP